MAKGQRMPRNQQMYNRPSKGFQQNMMKNMNMGIGDAPKMPGRKQTIAMSIAACVIVVGLIILFTLKVAKWSGFIPMLLGIAYFILFTRYTNKKQAELIAYYQKLGMTKKMFFTQLTRSGMKEKQIPTYSRIWDHVADPDSVKLKWYEKVIGM